MYILSSFSSQRNSIKLLAADIIRNRNFNKRVISISSIKMSTTMDKGSKDSINNPIEPTNIFTGKRDRFHGITINTALDTFDKNTFLNKFEVSLSHWLKIKTRAIWFHIDKKDAELVPLLANIGFEFHHAGKGFVMMYKWISDTDPDRVPPYAHTMVGCGAIVLNSKNQLLLVKERHYLIPKYKLPGGYVNKGENLIEAVQREVLEETNIKTQYHSFVCFRHAHKANFNTSDLYFVAHLTAVNEDIKIDPLEISDANWYDLDDVLKSDIISNHNRTVLEKFADCIKAGFKIDCQEHTLELINKQFMLYTMQSSNIAAHNV